MTAPPAAAFAFVPFSILLASVAAAQAPKVDPRVDPFTSGDPKAMEAAGIEAYAPFHWADDHTTADIERELGSEYPLRFAETRHFKIGIALPDRPWPIDKVEKKDIAEELDALAAKLPKARTRPKAVTSWLLVHLYARRLEDLYADFCKRTGWVDESPPCEGGRGHDGRASLKNGQLGQGKFLGQHGKFCVLIVSRRSDLGRYLRRYGNRDCSEPVSHHFIRSNSMLFITTPDIRSEGLGTERALYCNVAYGVVRNFVDGYRGFTYEIPAWNADGLAHWYRLRIDKKYNTIGNLDESQWELLHDADWPAKARARAESGAFSRAKDLVRWRLADCTDFHQHVMMWSRIDYLLSLGEEKFGKYLDALKGLPTTGVGADMVDEQQRKALREVYGLDEDAFDRGWLEWVKTTKKGK